jgi:hypothetical protein
LLQISHGQLTARKFDRYDINGYRFRTAKLEASRPLAATTNSGVVASSYSDDGQLEDYYGIVQDITEYTFGGHKPLRLVTFDCIWFDPHVGTRVDEFGMVEVKHASRYKGNEYNNIILAHQAHLLWHLLWCTSGPSNTEGATSHAAASVAPTMEAVVDEEAEEATAELEDGEETSRADASTEEAATQAAPRRAIRYSYC